MVINVARCCGVLRDVAYTVGFLMGQNVRGGEMACLMTSNHQRLQPV